MLKSRRKNINGSNENDLFTLKPLLLISTLVLLFVLAGVIRVINLDKSHLIAERQYRSALIARAYYFEWTGNISDWRKEAAFASKQRAGILEPEVMEILVSSIYWLFNHEDIRIGRLLSSVFWLFGGIFFYKVVKKLVDSVGAIFATAYYLFVPLGVSSSISFIPDPLMIFLFIVSLYLILWYFDNPTLLRIGFAAVVSGLAIFIRPLILFTLLFAFISLVIYKKRSLRGLIDSQILIFIIVSLLPTVLFYGYGMFIAGFLKWKAETSFLPQLLGSTEYWKSWLLTAVEVVGFTPLIMALLGIPMLRRGTPIASLIGLGIGYIFFCLLFTYHIRFAGYYHLQLIIIVGIAFAPLISLVINQLKRVINKWYWWSPVFIAIFLLFLINIREVRRGFASQSIPESQHISQEIGRTIDHSINTVYIATYYGMPLEYYGELSGKFWPRRSTDRDRVLGVPIELSVEERLNTLGFEPDYFVVTDFNEFSNHHNDLNEYLIANCSLLAETNQYLIYESCSQ